MTKRAEGEGSGCAPAFPRAERGPTLAEPLALRVHRLEPGQAARWDAFVHRHPEGTFFHLAGWKTVLERAFGHPTHYLVAEGDGEIRGVLPLGEIRSRLFGHALISTPFCVYGGILARDEPAHDALARAAVDLARELRVGHLELRNRRRAFSDWPVTDLYVTFRKAIDPDPEANLLAIPRKQRRMVRNGIKAGLTGELDPGIDRFYPIYAESVRNLGTPVFSRRYFATLRDVFGESCEVLTVSLRGKPLSSVLSFYFRDEVQPYYGGGVVESRTVAANDFLYWELMRRAAERGLHIFDFGRSKRDVGSFRFKKHWGFEPEPLHYECHLVRARSVPDVNPLNPRYRLFVGAWKRLPLPLSRLLGPMLSRSLG